MVLQDSMYDSIFDVQVTEVDVETKAGKVHCTLQGVPNASRPVILTFHDIGLNHKTCFSSLFGHEDMQEIVQRFALLHVDAPGQQEDATTLSTGYTYPSMEQLSETLPQILKHFGLKSVFGLGMGAGAYILANFALNYPDMVEGLTLININMRAEGLMDTVAQKITGWAHRMPDVVLSHLFGREEIQKNPELIETYRNNIVHRVNQANLHHFVKSYKSRHGLELERPVPGGSIIARTLKCQTLMVVGDQSPAVESVVDCNSKLDPSKTTLLKMSDCGGMPQVEQPAKLTEAFKYFIQGMGYMPSCSMTRLVRCRSRTASSSSPHSNTVERRSRSSHLQRIRSYTDPADPSTVDFDDPGAKRSTELY